MELSLAISLSTLSINNIYGDQWQPLRYTATNSIGIANKYSRRRPDCRFRSNRCLASYYCLPGRVAFGGRLISERAAHCLARVERLVGAAGVVRWFSGRRHWATNWALQIGHYKFGTTNWAL